MLGQKSIQLIVISIFTAVFSFGVAGVMLVVPDAAASILRHTYPDATEKWVVGQASIYQSVFFAITAFCCIIFLPTLGGIIDAYGRKPTLVASALSLEIATVVVFAAYYFNWIWMLLLSGIFMMCDGAIQVAGFAFITDISDSQENRSTNFGIIVGVSFGGIVSGSVLIGLLMAKSYLLTMIILLSMGVSDNLLASFLFVLFFLKEIRDEQEIKARREKQGVSLNPFKIIKLLFTSTPILTSVLVCYMLFNISSADTNSDFLYTQYRYGWGSKLNGIQTAVYSLSSLVWQLLGIRLVIKLCVEEWLLTIVLFLGAIINTGYGLATAGWIGFDYYYMFMTVSGIGGFINIAIPISEVIMSKQVAEEEQGKLFGGIVSLNFIAQFIACLKSDGYFSCPGTPFYIGAILLFIAFIIALVLFLRFPPKKNAATKYVPINSPEV